MARFVVARPPLEGHDYIEGAWIANQAALATNHWESGVVIGLLLSRSAKGQASNLIPWRSFSSTNRENSNAAASQQPLLGNVTLPPIDALDLRLIPHYYGGSDSCQGSVFSCAQLVATCVFVGWRAGSIRTAMATWASKTTSSCFIGTNLMDGWRRSLPFQGVMRSCRPPRRR